MTAKAISLWLGMGAIGLLLLLDGEAARDLLGNSAPRGTSTEATGEKGKLPEGAAKALVEDTRKTLREYAVKDRLAAKEAVERIQATFSRYREGIEPFVDQLYSLGGKWHLLKRTAQDQYTALTSSREAKRVERYVKEAWREHFGPADRMPQEITQALKHLRADLEGYRNQMLVEVSGYVAALDRFGQFDYRFDRESFNTAFEKGTWQAAESSARTALRAEALSLAGGELSAYALLRMVRMTLRGSTAALSASTAGSAAAGSSAASGGILASGWATLGVGIVVGIAVDYGMTQHAKARMKSRLELALSKLEARVMHGTDQQVGLYDALRNSLTHYERRKKNAVAASLRRSLGDYDGTWELLKVSNQADKGHTDS